MTIAGDHEAVHFTGQGVEVMQFFHEKKANFVNNSNLEMIGP